eukprot:CAMPEP_0197847304 /NCGR_PEP_ID=MMETSP1438-20131217/5697_1 /TAXON_ID=1461541 /ORGANISM="Pterosperma sp., Strain CCMP1384" /LENGTH=240 /DNA_ID=CAMNT_0043459179 /DNA_START=185 /DNA_END=907 /DNA_ORIENTATION=+
MALADRSESRSGRLKLEAQSIRDLKSAIGIGLPKGGTGMFSNLLTYPGLNPGTCDYCHRERVANVLTSAPFLWTGHKIMRNHEDKTTKGYGASVMGVGVASGVFHSFLKTENPKLKSVFRRLDYMAVSFSTLMLLKAARIEVPRGYYKTAYLYGSLNPLAMAACNIGIMETAYLKRVAKAPELKGIHKLHSVVAAVSIGSFLLEEFKEDIPHSHAVWHCTAAMSTATAQPLLPKNTAKAS